MREHLAELARALRSALIAEDGQGVVEYAVILMMVAIAALALMTAFGDDVSSLINSVASSFP
jgi:Flp pilus assembly pilin Flp